MTWQTMETAPRDGAEVLVYDQQLGCLVAWMLPIFDDAWVWYRNEADKKTCNPTHWMPLPARPKEEC